MPRRADNGFGRTALRHEKLQDGIAFASFHTHHVPRDIPYPSNDRELGDGGAHASTLGTDHESIVGDGLEGGAAARRSVRVERGAGVHGRQADVGQPPIRTSTRRWRREAYKPSWAATRVSRILVVDDEPQILRALRINLTARQYDVVTATDGTQALHQAKASRPDLIVLDLGLPDMHGVDVIRRLRSWTPVPIVVLSGRSTSNDKVDALDAGADDYVTKPFSLDELLARVRAVTRRHADPDAAIEATIGSYYIDFGSRTVTCVDDSTVSIHLTPTEWQLLGVLVRNPGKLVSQRQLLQEVWGPSYLTETHYLRQYMNQLRRKLEPDPARPRHLITEPGMGYRFQA